MEILDDEKPSQMMEEEEIKGIDFGEVPLMDTKSTKNLIEDDNFDFQVTNP